jgi:hypothetical protein
VKPPKKKPMPKNLRKALEPYVDEAEAMSATFLDEAKEQFQAELDYDIDSIRSLDKICRYNKLRFDDGMILRAGFFFGEILRRTYHGKYQWDTRVNALSLELGEIRIFPIEKIRKIVVDREPGTLEEYLMVLAKRLADLRSRKAGGGGPSTAGPSGV